MDTRERKRLDSVFGTGNPGPELEEEWRNIQRLAHVLQDSVQEVSIHTVKPFLSERVQRRLKIVKTSAEFQFQFLWQVLRPAGIVALVVIASLATYNATRTDPTFEQPTAVERILGLEPVTLTAAYDLNVGPLDLVQP